VLHALRDRIGAESAAHLVAQLPMLLRGLFYERLGPDRQAHQGASRGGVPCPIAKELPRAEEDDVEQGVTAVLDVLSKHLDRASDGSSPVCFRRNCANSGLPFIQEAARDRQAGAA
jgi:uncharacterized protein (DUF2267 family)